MFEKVAQADFVCGEHEMLRLWAEKRVFEKLRRQNSGKPKWCFLDGPITANNPMGVHHAWGRAYKDAYQRFFAMTGHELRYQNGFDCQGLWVEVEVERALGYTTRNAIIEHGIDTFVNECKKRVLRFAARQTEQSIRLGYWMDWDDPDQLRKLADALGTGEPLTITSPSGTDETATADDLVARLGNPQWGGSYFTFSTENNETIWAFLKKCHQRGKIYQGYDVMPWSGRGGSAYSQMEVADGRRLTVHKSCFVRFPIVDKGRGSEEADVNNSSSQSAIRNPQSAIENEYLLVWTTTPWTLTSNVAAAVNSDLDYVKLKTKRDGAIYYFAKENLDYQRLGREFKEGFGRPEWSWPKDVPKLKTIAQIFKEQGGYEVEETTKGAEMVGWTYSGPFDDMRAQWSDFEPKIRDLKAAFGLDQSKIAFSISGSNFAAVVASARDAIGTFALDVQTALDAIRPPLETLADRILVIKDLCPPSAASTLVQYIAAINLIQTFDPSSSSVTDSDSILSLRELLPAINANPQVNANFLAVALNRKLVEAYENVIEWLKKPKSGVSCHRVIDGGRDSKGQPNVVAGEGTGIVHIAPGCGDIDHKIGDEHHFVTIAPLEEDGRFCADFFDATGPVFTGLEAIDPDTAELVFKKLHEMHLLVASEAYPHVYPHCWRTGDELVFRLVDEWFINMDWRDEIKDVTQKITWLPNEIQGQEREVEWLTNMRDWMISKKRFWGLALPIWVDEETGDFEVMGSLSELKERAVEGWEQFEGHTPHRPWIDQVKIRNPKTGHLMSRILDVGNPWLDAGIVPFSTLHYNTSRDQWRQWYPADFVTECFPGQFRNWFYSLLALSTMMRYDETEDPMEKRPFKTLLGHRLVMNEQGEPMHKSDGTAIWFEEAAEQLGVDTMRWMYLAHNPTSDLRFGTRHPDQPVSIETPNGSADQTAEGEPICLVSSKPSDEIRRQILIPLWNSYKFFVNYAILDKFDPASELVPINKRPEIDRWILSNLQALIRQCRKGFEAFDVASACRAAAAFIDDLSNWYIRRNRRRFWSKQQEVEQAGDAAVRDKLAAYQTLYEVLVALTKLLAPAIPFLTERMYQNLVVSCQLSAAREQQTTGKGRKATCRNRCICASIPRQTTTFSMLA